MKTTKLNYDTWIETYKPMFNPNQGNETWETYGEDIKKVLDTYPEYIWTLLDCDGELYVSSGYHLVNRLNFFICEVPYYGEPIDFKYDDDV